MGRRENSATRSSGGSVSRLATMIHSSAPRSRALLGERTRAILLESPGIADDGSAGRSGDLRRRPRTRHHHVARQYLGDALALPGDRRRSRHRGPGGDEICRRPCRCDARHRDRYRTITTRLQTATWDLGHAVSPDDAWLASRGLRTMGVRLKQHGESALKIAQWLKQRPEVGLVLHPALPDCPGHELWKRDFNGSSGLFSFELKVRDKETRAAFVDGLELFGIGYSWGGYESLVLPVDPYRTVSKPPAPNLVRLHVGLEDPDDLDRRPRSRIRSGRPLAVDVARVAVAADEEFLGAADRRRAAHFAARSPDQLGIMADTARRRPIGCCSGICRADSPFSPQLHSRPWLRARKRAAFPPTDFRLAAPCRARRTNVRNGRSQQARRPRPGRRQRAGSQPAAARRSRRARRYGRQASAR